MTKDKHTYSYYQWHVLDRGRFGKGDDPLHPNARKTTAKKTIEDLLGFLGGDPNKPLSWYKLGRLLGIDRYSKAVYSWKYLRHRPNSYHCLQLLELYKLKHQFPLLDFNNVIKINWDKNIILVRDDDTIVNNTPFTSIELES